MEKLLAISTDVNPKIYRNLRNSNMIGKIRKEEKNRKKIKEITHKTK
jgi:hypothetical protein